MRSVRLAALILMTLGLAARPAAADDPVVPVRILDYARIPAKAIAHAQHLVSDLYRNAGVRTLWTETLDPSDPPTRPIQAVDPQELFVIILSQTMSRRLDVREGVIGFAPSSAIDGGRVAYVLSDRVWNVADGAGLDAMDLVGLVIAHEIGHLLLPSGSHTRDGLMRAVWSFSDLRKAHRRRLDITRPQAAFIRGMLAGRADRPLD